MRILLQHTKTGLYLQSSGVWIRDMKAAFNFGNSQCAIDYAREQGVRGAHVVAAFLEGSHVECVLYPIHLRPKAKPLQTVRL